MKNDVSLFLVTIILFTKGGLCYSQKENANLYTDNKNLYWFYVSVRITEDKVTGMKKYVVRKLGKKLESGTLDEYDKDLWTNLSKGYKLAIGPFSEHEEANQAQEFYSFEDDKVFSEVIDNEKILYYFTIRVYIRNRCGPPPEIERIPSAIKTGNADDFYELLKINLDFRQLAIGPFWNYETAEEAKRRYRLQ